MRRAQIFFLLVIFSASACSLQQDIEVELPKHTPVTLIECYLEPGVPARALVTKSVDYFEGAEVVPHDGLQLSLQYEGTTIALANEYFMDSVFSIAHNYTSTEMVHYAEGQEWELVLRDQEEEIARGKARFLPLPTIKRIDYSVENDSLMAIQVQIADDPEQENYYRLRVYMPGSPRHGFLGLWNDNMAVDGTLKMSSGHIIETFGGEHAIVNVYHIDKDYYEFLRSLQKAYDANYNPFAQPASITSNLAGKAEGIFTAITVASDTILIAP